MNVEFDRITLEQLLKNPLEISERTLCVPQFQRKYVWEKENEVLKLLEDFFGNLDEKYFFGPIILRFDKSQDEEIDIVDGQQRLITFSLLIRALIDILQIKKGEKLFSAPLNKTIDDFIYRFRDLIITGDVLKPNQRLKISRIINNDFKNQIIMNEEPNKSDKWEKSKKDEHSAFKNIKKAYSKIADYVNGFLQDYKTEDKFKEIINKIHNSLKNKLFFLLIRVENYTDAFTIFELINARGKGLTVPDLVKNLSFKNLYKKSEDENWLNELEDLWDDVETTISNFGDFIYHLWVSMNGHCPKSKVYPNLEKYLSKLSITDNEDFIVNTIPDEAKKYSVYENPELIKDKEVNETILKQYFALKSLRATRCYPVLLSLDYCVNKGRISEDEHLDFLKHLANLTFWYSGICEKDAKALETEYHSIAKKLREDGNPQDVLKFKENLNNYFPPKELSKENFISKQFVNKGLLNYILRSIEEYLMGEGELDLSKSNKKIQIEHILPLNPDSNSDWNTLFAKDDLNEEKYKIGNITLLFGPINRKISNSDFKKKKDHYIKGSRLHLNEEIIRVKSWDKQAIKKRGVKLFDYAQIIWPYQNG